MNRKIGKGRRQQFDVGQIRKRSGNDVAILEDLAVVVAGVPEAVASGQSGQRRDRKW